MPRRKTQDQRQEETPNSLLPNNPLIPRSNPILITGDPNNLPRGKPKKQPPIPIKPPKIPRIIRIMKDPDILGEIQDMAETGASLATIDARLKFPPNTMSNLLDKGRDKKSKIYYEFFMLFRSWVAEARHAAESNLAKRSPEKWLDRNSAARRIESEEDRNLAISSSNNNNNTPSIDATKMLAALKILREQNISIDEVLDKNQPITIEANDDE